MATANLRALAEGIEAAARLRNPEPATEPVRAAALAHGWTVRARGSQWLLRHPATRLQGWAVFTDGGHFVNGMVYPPRGITVPVDKTADMIRLLAAAEEG